MIQTAQAEKVGALIDQTLLDPTAARSRVENFCLEAADLGFASVCIAPCWVELAASILAPSKVRVCTVVGFPLGFEPVEGKRRATEAALAAGASEIDYVINLGAVKGEERSFVAAEMAAIRRAAEGAVVKAILETAYLEEGEKRWLCTLAVDSGLDFVKTATGFGPGGATVADVRLLCAAVQGRIKVKAAGGIRRLRELQELVAAGAQRIGTSAGKEIVLEAAAGRARS